ncbi:hypothetical protein COB21_04500 [Candidatus Aerophobetes bacterium]|uniref:N-acetyltransferase domain-containing protein n=1 Tax=Aerophobetes bacterium TaxID=2030807 RepID=A0A2A4X1F1_UNCAE|nr:MAG: hypothetical protein COB21_04500 [Candidatus Aerophobetes bacterium]
MSTIQLNTAGSSNYAFVVVSRTSPHFPQLTAIFKKEVVPLHGDQGRTLRKLGDDRQAEVLMRNDKIVGVIVYKKELQESNEKTKYPGGFEVKNIVVLQDSPRYVGMLVDRVVKLAKRALASSVYCIISSKDRTLDTVKTKGFKDINTWCSRVEGETDYLFSLKVSSRVQDRASATATNGGTKMDLSTHKAVADQGRRFLNSSYRESAPAERGSAKRGRDDRGAGGLNAPYKRTDRRLRTGESNRFNRNGNNGNNGHNIGRNQFSARPPSGPQAHRVTLKKKYIDQITHYGKTIEGRINSGMMLRFKEGDTVTFFAGRSAVTCDIVAIRKHPNFREMLEKEGVRRCLADVATVEEGAGIYDRIPGYSRRASQSGVLAIEIKVKKGS